MTAKQQAAHGAGQLLRTAYDGVLSTLSQDLDGYPFGSVMPFALSRDGVPIIQIARIAQHTRNITADPKVSLIVFDRNADDLQTHARLTLVADAAVATDNADIERYYARFPESRSYESTHSFDFFRLDPVRCRFIGGFGEIYWFDPDKIVTGNPFTHEQERAIVDHMNADHRDALLEFCELTQEAAAEEPAPVMAGVDGFGFDIKMGKRVLRRNFSQHCETSEQVRAEIVSMLKSLRTPEIQA